MLPRPVVFQPGPQNLERGGTDVEVGLTVAVIAIIVVVAATFFGTEVSSLFGTFAVGV